MKAERNWDTYEGPDYPPGYMGPEEPFKFTGSHCDVYEEFPDGSLKNVTHAYYMRILKEEGLEHLVKPAGCEICGKPPTGHSAHAKTLHWDHDHKTGEFRGWLCWQCNTALGKLGDNLEGLMKAVNYLKRAGETV